MSALQLEAELWALRKEHEAVVAFMAEAVAQPEPMIAPLRAAYVRLIDARLAVDRSREPTPNTPTVFPTGSVGSSTQPPASALTDQLIQWLDDNVRRCGHGYVYITCGQCCAPRLGR